MALSFDAVGFIWGGVCDRTAELDDPVRGGLLSNLVGAFRWIWFVGKPPGQPVYPARFRL